MLWSAAIHCHRGLSGWLGNMWKHSQWKWQQSGVETSWSIFKWFYFNKSRRKTLTCHHRDTEILQCTKMCYNLYVHISNCLVFHYFLHNVMFSNNMLTFTNPKQCSESSNESTTVCVSAALVIALFTNLRKKKKVTSDSDSSFLHVCPSSDCVYSRSANEKPKWVFHLFVFCT